MECTYETTINGKKIKFSSEMELDNFLSSKLADYQINESDLTFQINPIDSTIEKVNAITSKVKNASIESVIINDDGDSETILKIPDSIGTTRFITSNGDPSNMQKELVPPFNLNDFLKKERERLSAEGMTKSQIDSYLEKLQKSWTQLTDYGTEIHSLFESIINNTTFKPTNLSEEQVLRLTEEFKSFIEDIKSKYGKNAKILTEVPIISDKIHEAYLEGYDGVMLNAGAWTHYSHAIGDALRMLECPVIELHMSNVHAREEFRHHSVISPIASGIIVGLGSSVYTLGLRAFDDIFRGNND